MTVDSERDFFDEIIKQVQQVVDGPWIITGDFNTVRSSEDTSTGRATLTETTRFNMCSEIYRFRNCRYLTENLHGLILKIHPYLQELI
jgi:endonuclease/exonuclease/phosphatase (EEP) superfamily protein YafD